MPDNSGVDFAMMVVSDDGRMTMRSVLEVKCRTIPMGTYTTYILSEAKFLKLQEWCQNGFRAGLAVRWTDALGLCAITAKDQFKTRMGGRKDRNDPRDQEMMVEIPISRFKRLTP